MSPAVPTITVNFHSILDPQAAAVLEQAHLEADGAPSLRRVCDVLFTLIEVQVHAVKLRVSRARLADALDQVRSKASGYRESAATDGLGEFLGQLSLRANARGRSLYATEVLEALVAFGGSPVTFDVGDVVAWAERARRIAEAHGRPLTLGDAARALAELMSVTPERADTDGVAGGSTSVIAPESLLAHAILAANSERAEDLSLRRVRDQLFRAPAWRRELLLAGCPKPELAPLEPPSEVESPNARLVFHDDDVTTVEFVTRVLQEVLDLPHAEAIRLTATIDEQGWFAVGPFPTSEATAFVMEIRTRARESGYPLRVSLQPA